MTEILTKTAARNVFYGGTAFFFAIFAALVAHSYIQARDVEATHPISEAVARGKRVWEKHACFDCHTMFGEGARYAPEVGQVWLKYGGDKDADGARTALKEWFKAQPLGIADRHQMPNFKLSEQDLDDVIEFLRWTSGIDLQGWPPKKAK
ncbi:MAG TPA: cytochrome c [Methylocystis sp.]|nr:cytochrome c [Methylocystis sp.]